MKYAKEKIGEYVTLRQGFAINKKTRCYISDEPTSLHLLRIGDMKEDAFQIYIKDSIPRNFIANKNDIIYSRTGQVGLVFRNQYGVVHNNCFTVTPKNENVLSRDYLFYALQCKDFYEEAKNKASGAAQPDLPHDAFKSIKICLPNIDKQNKIANILSTYDSLIENNKKQIKLLEEAAQRLYKKWFIDFHFPGYEDTAIVGGVPNEWQRIPLQGVIGYEIGGGWGSEMPTKDCEMPAFVIRGTDLFGLTHGDFAEIPYRFHGKSNLEVRQLIDGDIIFEVSGGSKTEGVAKTVLIRQSFLDTLRSPVMCASFCKLIRVEHKEHAQYLYDTLQYLRRTGKTVEFDKRSASSIVNYRWKDFLQQQQIWIPEQSVLAQYTKLAENIYQKILACSIQIVQINKARDRLLPKLMSGALEV